MNLLSMAEQLASLDLSPIHVDASRCLRAKDPQSTCDQCVRTCPTGALSLNKSIVVNSDACVRCGQCVHDCPVGAVSGPDKVPDVWGLALRFGNGANIEVACSQHPSPEVGSARADAVLRIGTCLTALSPAAYIGLLSLGVEQVAARVDVCNACPLGKAKATIEQSIATTQQLLAARHEANRVTSIEDSKGNSQRPVYTKNTGMSRRELFRRLTPMYQPEVDQVIQSLDAGESAAKQPPRERTRLLKTLRRLPPSKRAALSASRLENLPFARLSVDEKCSACGVCARICPTGALNLVESDKDHFQLTFASSACVNCGLCLRLCEPEALHREDATLADVLEAKPVTLKAGGLAKVLKVWDQVREQH